MNASKPAGWTLIPINSWPVYAFGENMTRPYKLSGADPVYTREALQAPVQGLIIVKCIIWADGHLSSCRITMARSWPDASSPLLPLLNRPGRWPTRTRPPTRASSGVKIVLESVIQLRHWMREYKVALV